MAIPLDAKEQFPGNEAFGKRALSTWTFESALEILHELESNKGKRVGGQAKVKGRQEVRRCV